jgi:hypothetical protein
MEGFNLKAQKLVYYLTQAGTSSDDIHVRSKF